MNEKAGMISLDKGGGRRILLWGIGNCYQQNRTHIRDMADAFGLTIVGVTAAHRGADRFDGLAWFDKDEVTLHMTDWVVVMSEDYFYEIMQEAVEAGIDRSRIVGISLLRVSGFAWQEVIEVITHIAAYISEQQMGDHLDGLPTLYHTYGFSWAVYQKAMLSLRTFREPVDSGGADVLVGEMNRWKQQLRECPVSMIAMNCSGGYFYHDLGMQFLSPFINLWIPETDFLRLLQKPRWYVKQSLRLGAIPFQEGGNRPGNNAYPMFLLGDIPLHMNHATDIMQAAQKWYERCKRIRWDRLAAIMYADNPLVLQRLDACPIERKICFVPFQTNMESAFCVDRQQTHTKWMWEVAIMVCRGIEKTYQARMLKRLAEH